MKTLKQLNCIELPLTQLEQINGGAESPKTGFWQDVAWLGGAIFHGFVVFGTEGGRNAGISVK